MTFTSTAHTMCSACRFTNNNRNVGVSVQTLGRCHAFFGPNETGLLSLGWSFRTLSCRCNMAGAYVTLRAIIMQGATGLKDHPATFSVPSAAAA